MALEELRPTKRVWIDLFGLEIEAQQVAAGVALVRAVELLVAYANDLSGARTSLSETRNRPIKLTN